MYIHRSKKFDKEFSRLPPAIQEIAERQIGYIATDDLLRCKKVKGKQRYDALYTCRVTRKYRIIFYTQNGTATMLAISHRKNVYADNVNDESLEREGV